MRTPRAVGEYCERSASEVVAISSTFLCSLQGKVGAIGTKRFGMHNFENVCQKLLHEYLQKNSAIHFCVRAIICFVAHKNCHTTHQQKPSHKCSQHHHDQFAVRAHRAWHPWRIFRIFWRKNHQNTHNFMQKHNRKALFGLFFALCSFRAHFRNSIYRHGGCLRSYSHHGRRGLCQKQPFLYQSTS